jgi:hypothetical protein
LSEDNGEVPPGTTQIHVTEEERDAIERVRNPVCASCGDCSTNSILAVSSRL